MRSQVSTVLPSASIYLFLSYFGLAMSFTPLTELFIERMCAESGLDVAHCKPKIDGKKNPKYDDAQGRAAQASVLYTLATGVPPLITCSLFGCLGDAYGRRLPLIMPILAGVAQGIAFAATNSNDAAIIICAPLAFGGGMYVSNLCAFSSLADVTRNSSAKKRALVFSLVEAAIWVGLLMGPVVGGEMAHIVGNQHAFYVSSAVGLVNLLITLFTYPDTLDCNRRRAFSWRRANPFASIHMFLETRATVLLGLILLLSLTAQSGGLANVSLYALKVSSGMTPTLLGLLQSTLLGAAVIGLVVVMPLLVRCISLEKIVVLSCLDGAIAYLLMALVSQEWQLFAVGACLFFAGCYFPVVRCGMANTFGSEHYGEALAAVGVVEQLCQLIGAPIINGVYQGTESVEFSIGSLTVHSIACVSAAGMYLIAVIAGFFLQHVPHEGGSSFIASGSLISDCQEGSAAGRKEPSPA